MTLPSSSVAVANSTTRRPARSVHRNLRDFFNQPRFADAVSYLFRDVFGTEKMAVRLVIGVARTPTGTELAGRKAHNECE